tara:strand:+ start:6022 stop:6195 length:174 start_codon:yes stop_codon:yes gene_type:complete
MKAAKKLKNKFGGGGGMAGRFKKKPVGISAPKASAAAPAAVEQKESSDQGANKVEKK